jgi:N-6 DNA Methylase
VTRPLKRAADIGLAAISVEGGLIAPEQLAVIAAATPDLKTAAEYGCPKGTSLRDEITRYFRIGQAHWQSYARIESPTVTQTAAFVKALLEEAFGFALTGPHTHSRDDHRFRIAWEAKGGRVPIVVAAPIEGGEAFTKSLPEFGDGADGRSARRSPAILLQDWLNASPEFYWGLVFAGDRVRLMRDNASFTRPAFIEADIGAIFRDEMFADFTALWLLIHASRFGAEDAGPSDCALERWREAGHRAGTAARDRLRGNVEDALTALGQGFLDGNPALRGRLDDGSLSMQAWFEQLLRLVYRMIFLAVAEDRDLLHPPSATKAATELYASGYGFAYLRDRAAKRSSHDHHHDAWEGAKIVLRALEQGEKQLGLPALGGLFARGLTPDLDSATLPNRNFLTAVFRLSWLIDEGRRVRINWRDMATEELGSVYEGLLELVPVRGDDGRSFAFAGGAEAKGNARKISGSYYTPDSLVQTLLDSALDPVLQRAEDEGGVDAILALDVIDPACGSGHFLLGAARRMATRVAQIRANADGTDAPDYARAMRDVARNCIHGVDRNPMAVELAKVALWIETVEPGKPLGFLDTNLVCGDSLLGIFDLKALEDGIPDDAYKPLTGDDKETAVWFRKKNKAEREGQGSFDWAAGGGGGLPPAKLAADMEHLRDLPEDTVAEVEAKRSRFAAWVRDPKRYATKVACDLYVSAFLSAKRGGVPDNANSVTIPTTAAVRAKLSGAQIYGPLEAASVDLAETARTLHWPLAFPEVMIGKGGFDVVIGNPPWERIKLQEQEFFASRDPDIANASNKAERERLIKALTGADGDSPASRLYGDFQTAKRVAEASSIVARVSSKDGGRFRYTGTGDVNTYALFAEHFLNLLGRNGRAGIIVPTGIATDVTTANFFGHLMSERRVVRLFDFENSAPIFSGVHRSFKFCLLTLGSDVAEAEFSFFLTDPVQLEDTRRRFSLSSEKMAATGLGSGSAPTFRSQRDAELGTAIAQRAAAFASDNKQTGSWNVRFHTRIWHMSEDVDFFRTAAELQTLGGNRIDSKWVVNETRYAPLFESKMINFFDHRYAGYQSRGDDRGHRVLPPTTMTEHCNTDFEVDPFYWVPESEVVQRLDSFGWKRDWLFGWKEITSPTTERSLVVAAIPKVAVGHKFPLIFPESRPTLIAALHGCLSSLVVDFVARQRLGSTSFTLTLLKQLPILPPTAYSEADLDFIAARVLELSYTSHAMAPFALDLGYGGPPFGWDENRRAQLRADLDAWYALAYGLSRDELRYVLDPKDVMGEDYPSETFRVLQKNEIAKCGEYRTARLVLAAYDQLANAAPELSAVADDAWDHRIDATIDVRHIFAAIMKKTVGPVSPLDVRLTALFAAKPHLLMHYLSSDQQIQWRRLVGNQADLQASTSVAAFSAATPTAFTDAIDQLRAERSILYDMQARTWDRGAAIYHYASLGWADGRAAFVLHAMRSITTNTAVAALPQEERDWIAIAA